MVEIAWTEPALSDLDAIADYIAIEDAAAAGRRVRRIVQHVEQLAMHPDSGGRPRELGKRTRYRQIVEPPCRVFYRFDGTRVLVLHVMRSKRLLRPTRLQKGSQREPI